MRRVMGLVLIALVLNCSSNVFADTSSQNENILEGNAVTEGVVEEDTTVLSEVLTESDTITLPDSTIEAGPVLTEIETEEVTTQPNETIEEEPASTEIETEEVTTQPNETIEEVTSTEIETEGVTTQPNETIEEEPTSTEIETEEVTTQPNETIEEEPTSTEIETEEVTTQPNETTEEEPISTEIETEEVTTQPNETTEEEPVDESETESSEEIDLHMENDYVYNVSIPASTTAYLDPGNVSGRGQIFSENYVVENYGNTDIVIKIKNIDISCRSEEDLYEFTKDEITDRHSMIRKLNVNIVWKNENENTEKTLNVIEGSLDECVLLLRASEYDENAQFVGLNDGSTGFFYFTGTMNSNRDIVWEDDDIAVRFDYEIIYAEGQDDIDIEEQEEESYGDLAEEETDIEEEEQQSLIETTEENTLLETDTKEETESTIESIERIEESETVQDTEKEESESFQQTEELETGG